MPSTQTSHRRRAKPKGDGDGNDSQRWLLTYADAITLMLVFCIILYAISEADQKKFRMFVSAVQDGFSIFGMGGGRKPGQMPTTGTEEQQKFSVFSSAGVATGKGAQQEGSGKPSAADASEQEKMTGMDRMQATHVRAAQRALQHVRKLGAGDGAWLEVNDNEIRLVILDSVLFNSRCTSLTTKGRRILVGLARDLRAVFGSIRVEGHTGRAAPKEPRYPTNWDLSCGKAVLVARFLVDTDELEPSRLHVVGRSRYQPVKDASSPDDPRNARIELVLPLK